MLTKEQKQLIQIARKKYGVIFPLGNRGKMPTPGFKRRHFTKGINGELIFWFNTLDNSSHVVREGKPL